MEFLIIWTPFLTYNCQLDFRNKRCDQTKHDNNRPTFLFSNQAIIIIIFYLLFGRKQLKNEKHHKQYYTRVNSNHIITTASFKNTLKGAEVKVQKSIVFIGGAFGFAVQVKWFQNRCDL